MGFMVSDYTVINGVWQVLKTLLSGTEESFYIAYFRIFLQDQ